MKFDPATMSLMTDDERLIKVLACHMKMRLDQLKIDRLTGHRHCDACAHRVLDTALLTQQQVEEQVEADPAACLIVRRSQHNIEII